MKETKIINTTIYFKEQVLRQRAYIKLEWCQQVISNPIHRERQSDGRIRYWGYVQEINKYLCVITLEDGVTIHNAFPDRNFTYEGFH